MNRDAALDRPLVMPELFHGKPSDDFEAWLQNFDISAVVNRWDDKTRRQILLVRLRGPAQRLVLGLPEAALDDSLPCVPLSKRDFSPLNTSACIGQSSAPVVVNGVSL